MPLMGGKSKHVIAKNIKEMIAAGHEPKQAVAAALSNARKMAMGGMVDVDDDAGASSENDESALRSLAEIQDQGISLPDQIMNPQMQMHDDMLAKALFKKSEDVGEYGYADGGLVEVKDTDTGNEPSMDMVSDTDEPMSEMPEKPADEEDSFSRLSPGAQAAIMARRKKRMRF